jgi:parallel beta-helix repeat protein
MTESTGNPGPGSTATTPEETALMFDSHRLLAAALVLGSLLLLPGIAHAARSYDSCTGFVDSVPATITTPGVWCLRKDLGTSVTSGNAVTIAANNVTLDCNDFKLGGLEAGKRSSTRGIRAGNRQNVAVRHCNVRGFHVGIDIFGGAGHLVEDNRLNGNLYVGISVHGENSLVRRNRVYDTGGAVDSSYSYGILSKASVIDNTVDGVFAMAADASSRGIELYGRGRIVRNNQVRRLTTAGAGTAVGISSDSPTMVCDGNQVISSYPISGTAINGSSGFCRNNTVAGFSNLITNCDDAGGNVNL